MGVEYKVGDVVRYVPEWCSAGEHKYLHVLKENLLNPVEKTMTRWLIQTIDLPHMVLKPTQVVDEFMIEPTGFNILDFDNLYEIEEKANKEYADQFTEDEHRLLKKMNGNIYIKHI